MKTHEQLVIAYEKLQRENLQLQVKAADLNAICVQLAHAVNGACSTHEYTAAQKLAQSVLKQEAA